MSTITPAEKLSSEEEAHIQSLTTGLLLLPILVLAIFLNAYVILLFWNWFVVPLGPKPLGYWHALGLTLFVGFIRYGGDRNKEYPQDAQGWRRRCREGYTALVFFWISGWLVHLLMQHFAHQ